MSMRMLTIFQFIQIMSVYLLMTVLLPAFVLRVKIKEYRLAEKFLICFLTGNFYMMNLVFVLQLLHISNRVTLCLGTFVPAFIVWLRLNEIKLLPKVKYLWQEIRRLSSGYLGIKTVVYRIFGSLFGGIKSGFKMMAHGFFSRWLEWLFLLAVLAALASFYGIQLLRGYGYTASDTPVHLFWINGLEQNQIFIDGVYPFGYHCVIYYLHKVFQIDSYVMMRIFSFVQTVMIHIILLAFLRLCCKSKYIAYAVVGIYAVGNFLQPSTYLRFFSVLPQEYGMLFILPSIYFAFRFFALKRKELLAEKKMAVKKNETDSAQDKKERKKLRARLKAGFLRIRSIRIRRIRIKQIKVNRTTFKNLKLKILAWRNRLYRKHREKKRGKSFACLVLFAMSFSMTLAVHFYDTMIAGIFCVGVAVGYLFLFVRKPYFKNVVITGLISVMIAVLPMGIAFALGTPLQGSLNWGMSVINGESWNGEGGDKDKEEEPNVTYYDAEGNQIEKPTVSGEDKKVTTVKVKEPLITRLHRVWNKLCDAITGAVLNEPQPWYYLVVLTAMFGLLVLGGFFFLFRKYRCYGAMLMSVGVFIFLLLVLQAAGELGLPELMDGSRCRIYFGYMLPVVFGLFFDGLIRFIFFPRSWKFTRNAVSLMCAGLAIFLLSNGEFRKPPVENTTLVTNEAIACLTNIIREEKDFTWTICSANDETQMGLDHGYHYELISFLREMELSNMKKDANPFIKIPTDSVYFFIEKIPIDYTLHYEKSGQSISKEGADNPIPNVGGIEMYKGENRFICMSRMYYWAQEFKRMYPNEVKTYCETDNFVCYKIEQNAYRLYNFAIDYGYNSRKRG